MPAGYWNEQFAPFNSGFRTIGAGIAQLPAMTAMAANRAAQAQLYADRGQDAAANAELARQKTQELLTETQEGNDLADSGANYVKTFGDATSKPEDRSAAAIDFTRKAGLLMAKDPEKFQTVASAIIQRMQANPTDLTQQFEANNPGKLVTGNDVLNDQQLAAAQAKKDAPATQTPNQIAAGLKDIVGDTIISGRQSTPIPIDPATTGAAGNLEGKPFQLTIAPAIQARLKASYGALAQAGDPEAEYDAQQLVMGTNSIPQPNVVTNTPGTPAIPGHLWDTPAVPPVTSTNSFLMPQSGADQTMIAKLMQDPKLAGVIQQIGLAPSATSTATNAPVSASAAPVTPFQPNAPLPTAQPAQSSVPTPTADDVNFLAQNQKNPVIVQRFEQRFGAGSANKYLP